MSDWCRLDSRILRDSFWLSLSPTQRCIWVSLMALAAETDGVILVTDVSKLSRLLDVSTKQLRSLLVSASDRLSITDESIEFKQWRKYNPPRESSSERVRAWREKKRVTCVTPETPCNGSTIRNETNERYKTNETPMSDAVEPLHTSRAPEPARTNDGDGPTTAACQPVDHPIPTSTNGKIPNPFADKSARTTRGQPKTEARMLCDDLEKILGVQNENDRRGIWIDFSAAASSAGLETVRRIIGEMREAMNNGIAKNPIGLARTKLRACYKTA